MQVPVLRGVPPRDQRTEGARALPPDARREGCSPLVRRGDTELVDVQAIGRHALSGLPGVARPQGPTSLHGTSLSVVEREKAVR